MLPGRRDQLSPEAAAEFDEFVASLVRDNAAQGYQSVTAVQLPAKVAELVNWELGAQGHSFVVVAVTGAEARNALIGMVTFSVETGFDVAGYTDKVVAQAEAGGGYDEVLVMLGRVETALVNAELGRRRAGLVVTRVTMDEVDRVHGGRPVDVDIAVIDPGEKPRLRCLRFTWWTSSRRRTGRVRRAWNAIGAGAG